MSLKYTPAILKRTEQLLGEANYTVRYEKGNFSSGYCLLEQRRIVIVNKFLNLEGKINTLVELLPLLDIDPVNLNDDLRKWYDKIQASTKPIIENNQQSLNL